MADWLVELRMRNVKETDTEKVAEQEMCCSCVLRRLQGGGSVSSIHRCICNVSSCAMNLQFKAKAEMR